MNEPAFPHMMAAGHRDYAGGMTLRDFFAAQALVAMGNWTDGHSLGLESAAKNKAAWAYRIADAMLAARGVQSSPQESESPAE